MRRPDRHARTGWRVDRASLHRFALLCLATGALGACTTVQITRPLLPPTPPVEAGVLVPERYLAAGDANARFDALATWPTENGGAWLIAGSAANHALTVFDADSGARIRDIDAGNEASGPPLEPAALAVFGDHLFVADARARRVAVLFLPDFTPIGSFGEGELSGPDGLWIRERGPQELAVHVADQSAGQRVWRRYRVEFDDAGQLHAKTEAALDDMGAADAGDDLPRDGNHGIPNGSAWWSCGTDAGYRIEIDPGTSPASFRVLDRNGGKRGIFHGETAAGSDAITLYAAGTMQFPFGVLFAVHQGHSVAAFDLGDVARALQLDAVCTQ